MTAPALPTPRTDLAPNTADFERLPFVKPTGFREYDARWLFPQEINLMGMQAIGMAMATLMRERGVPARIVTGHDYRSYSSSIKCALMSGMLAGGAEVHDIGLALSPTAYFAQFALEVEGVAMVTASHNDNGWTGIKMGMGRPLTFGPDEMSALKRMVLEGRYQTHPGGSYHFHADMAQRYMDDLANRAPFKRKIKAVVACGNGTAGAFAPQVLERLGLRGGAAQHRPRLQFPEPQSESGRPENAARHLRCSQGVGRGCGPRLRRRRRPLRRRRQRGQRDFRRQGRRDARARHFRRARECEIRRGCEIDGAFHHRSRAAGERRAHRLLEDWPLLYQAL